MASSIATHASDFLNIAYNREIMAGRPTTKPAPEFGQRLAAARQQRGLTQEQLAHSIGASQKMIDYYERRAVNIKSDVIRKLAHTLQISVDELMGAKPLKAKPGPKSRLWRQFAQVERLSKSDQQLVSRLLNRFLEKAA